jgi:hypothetical protein
MTVTVRARLAGIVCAALAATSVMRAQDQGTRAIVPEAFLKARPAPPSKKTSRPVYRPVSPAASTAARPGGAEIGVTLWRLRPARATDGPRLLVHGAAGRSAEWTPERAPIDQPLTRGDQVRLTIEAPRAGHLYVIDSEQYADGSLGTPTLIFPTTRTRGGDNAVAAGRLIDIPDQDDAPPYFTLQASRADHVGERLTLLITREPIADVTIGAGPLTLTRERVAEWEARGGGGGVERLDLVSGGGRAWTKSEQAAAKSGGAPLTQEDPPPQTLFRVHAADPGFVAVQVEIGRMGPRR